MKNILLLVHDDAGQEARVQAALDVTRALDGHLSCIDVAMFPDTVGGDYWGGTATALVLADERVREAENREKLQPRLAREGVSWNWIDATGDIATCLERAAILHELIVVNRRIDAFLDTRSLAAELILKSGKPILAVPDKVTGFKAAGRALVAWNGSREADAALQAAIPLLALASHVTVLEVFDGSDTSSTQDAAALLSRHGIHALVVRELAGKDVPEDVILRVVAEREIDYVVMGGFGHSRAREAIFGGVSRKMLTDSPVPLLLAH